jgi:hypothetical protein
MGFSEKENSDFISQEGWDIRDCWTSLTEINILGCGSALERKLRCTVEKFDNIFYYFKYLFNEEA